MLSKETIERIEKEAKQYAEKFKANISFEGIENIVTDYMTAATSEATKAIPLLEALERIVNISNNEGMPNSIVNPYTLLIEIEKAAQEAIENYNKPITGKI